MICQLSHTQSVTLTLRRIQGKVKFQSISASDLLVCMLPTFCPPMIWVISLEFCVKPSILNADDLLGAC